MMLSIHTQTFPAEPTKVAAALTCPHRRFENLRTGYGSALAGRSAR